MAYKRLGDMLVSEGLLTPAQLAQALELQRAGGQRLGTVLTENGYVTQAQITGALERQLGVEYIDLMSTHLPPETAALLPRTMARQYGIVPVRLENGTLYIAMDDPLNFVAVEAVKKATRHRVVPMIATAAGIDRAINALYGGEAAQRAIRDLNAQADSTPRPPQEIPTGLDARENSAAAPTTRLVNSILEYAVSAGASDIHMEPHETEMIVRIRVDGALHRAFVVPRATQESVIARIKVMGNMDVAEHKVPLDGRSRIRVGERDIDLRISTLPTIYGEKAVIRLLDKSTGLLTLEGIGLEGDNLAKFTALLGNANGVILIVGPTGSGKSSTMYAMIRRLNTESVNLVTLEDPVEYNIDGVNQVQINEKTGMTFASGLRSILRQDPDIIAVGEIRDGETAAIAMRAAITGHLVLSTIHTNDAPSTLERLTDIGVEPYLTASALKGVVSQRLVRRICPHCKEAYTPAREEQEMLHLPYDPARRFWRGRGCPACFGTGYHGRTGVFEILTVTADLRRAIADRVPYSELDARIGKSAFVPLERDCVRLVLAGVTTADEAYRTVNSTDT